MSEVNIDISFTARSKTFRLYGEAELKRLVREMEGSVYSRRSKLCEYQLRAQEYTIVMAVNNGHIDVITQMHHHIDHHHDSDFEHVHVDSADELCTYHENVCQTEVGA